MTAHQEWYLSCTNCGRQYHERGETEIEVRDLASDDGWTREVMDNGSLWDFCDRCTKRHQERQLRMTAPSNLERGTYGYS
jgi:hypothetical protein